MFNSSTAMSGWARAGYAARGLVYLLVGGLALMALLGAGGRTTDSRGALQTLVGEPFGLVTLTIVALSLVGYALWRSIQAFADADRHGRDLKAIAIRAGLFASAIVHLTLAGFVIQLVVSAGGSDSSGQGSQGVAQWLLQQPFGKTLLGATGVLIMVVGIAHGVKGWREQFAKHLQMRESLQSKLYPVCRFGLISRGVVLAIIGSFFIWAAVQADASQAQGVAGVMDFLRQQVFGKILLGAMALGLMAFGCYSLILSRYRRLAIKGV
ncbi:DUF1206 domain-containing protein [Gilvimarinus xylanilyticus]|uniref:DUF1206 domain-containing protein n=1 Tax=Gilvimarinus xylanilyticus TaxID=2944139 RepID=A0A9X2KUM1_9GAMM|nr:DUF1206 domain-containing protein [Gilvimarinus xylanilyticus]MCP8899983.1 DUF1206 domain-containing protein [Gilvimarinus xylanilyticus]